MSQKKEKTTKTEKPAAEKKASPGTRDKSPVAV